MKRTIYIISIVVLTLFTIEGCNPAPKPKQSAKQNSKQKIDNTEKFKLKELNKKLLSKMPITQKIGDNSIKIVGAEIQRDSEKRDGIVVNSDFIYKSFAIPEGIAGRVTLEGKLKYNELDNNLYLYGLRAVEYNFANSQLARYITPKDKELISQMVAGELSLIPIYKMKKDKKHPKIVNIDDSNLSLYSDN